jgi:hypothetical protein
MNQYGLQLVGVFGIMFLIAFVFKSNMYRRIRGVHTTNVRVGGGCSRVQPRVDGGGECDLVKLAHSTFDKTQSTAGKPFSICDISRGCHQTIEST